MLRHVVLPVAFFLSSISLAQPSDIPLNNWTVPPYTGASAGGIHTMVDQTPPRAFIGLPVCRLLDTRPPANNPLDGDGAFTPEQVRTYTLWGACGIPIGADAVSLNITVTNTGANAFGHIKIWPGNQVEPNVSTLNWAAASVTESNAAIVALSPSGQINVKSGNAGSDVILDTNGYFSDVTGSPGSLLVVSTTDIPAIIGRNSSTLGGAFGVHGHINTTTTGPASAGVRGQNDGTGGAGVGVWGSQAGSGWGVFGETPSGVGVYGKATATTGVIYGMRAEAGSTAQNSAGVRASNGPAPPNWTILSAGVRGEAPTLGIGVVGMSRGWSGVGGYFMDTAGNIVSGADLGYGPTVGVNATGIIQATGMKNFIEPHPTDPSKMIRYTSLEGNEAGTYFRGRGKFQNGLAVIEVPEDFRIVTDPEGLSIQLTPIGQMASVAVQAIGLDRIVVRGSRDVEFFYTVNGVRAAYKDAEPIVANEREFVPRSPDASIPDAYPERIRQRLIANGTYRPDGTVNVETAHRLGWDKAWAEREQPSPE